VAEARELLGTPYRYGGATPRGFDCSGLVYYTHRKVGLAVPRSTREQLERARPVDLVFFRLSWNKVSHVGIYAGNNRFIHAPTSGKWVSIASLENDYWEKRLVAAGRFYGS
jgi:cell wall-associated NlpC family hydrolase